MSIERRQFSRSLFSLENEIIAKFTIPRSQEKHFIVHVLNISEGGVFFTWRSHRNINLQVGDHITFQEIRKGDRMILSLELTAKIVWKSEEFSLDHTGVGTKFIDLSPEILTKIDQFIASCQNN